MEIHVSIFIRHKTGYKLLSVYVSDVKDTRRAVNIDRPDISLLLRKEILSYLLRSKENLSSFCRVTFHLS